MSSRIPRTGQAYMRYSIVGGYQSNGENWSGSDYCITASDGYRTIVSIDEEIRDAMVGWMNSPGHQRNILDKWHKKVNTGLAWDRYNFVAAQHFEGDYVEYDPIPAIEDGILTLSGTAKNGVAFENERDLSVHIRDFPYWESSGSKGNLNEMVAS